MNGRLFSPTDPDGASRLQVLLVAIGGVASTLFGERVPAGGGLGWDGVTYARLVRELPALVETSGLSSYYAQRILPPAAVRAGLLAGGSDLADAAIIHGFQVWNLVMVLGTALAWARIAAALGLGVRGRWIAFAGMFLSFQASKLLWFYPVLTDATALLLGTTMLLGAIERRPIVLLVATVLGALTWPVAGVSGAALLATLGARPSEAEVLPSLPTRPLALAALGSFGIGAVTLPVLQIAWMVGHDPASKLAQGPLTALPSLVAAGAALLVLAGSPAYLLAAIRSVRPAAAALAAVAFLAPTAVVRAISSPDVPAPSDAGHLVQFVLLPPANKVFLPYLGAVALWGPACLLAATRWPDVAIAARRLGPGFVAIVAATVLLALPTEPRYLTLGWPFLVAAIASAFDRARPSRAFDWTFAGLVALLSHAWLPLTLVPWTGADEDDLQSFPKQLYFMHFGMWMGWPAYAGYAAVTIAGIAALNLTLRPRPSPEP